MALQISCDESGHTGPDLLSPDQRYFAYASVNIDDDEAWKIISRARTNNPVQMPELKAARLMKTRSGRALIRDIFKDVEGKFAINAHDKLVALCGWIFEYIYEPVYQKDPKIFYEKNFHRFVAMFCWLWFQESGSEANAAIQQFQQYMRTRDVIDAPLFFDRTWPPLDKRNLRHPFECVLRFAAGYKDVISADNARLNSNTVDRGRWILDLSASALWSHLNYWGKFGEPLQVQCDVSKPLQAIVKEFGGDHSDPGIVRARQMGRTEKLGWKLARPVDFVDSRNHPSVQIADIIGGTAVQLFSNGLSENFDAVAAILDDGMMRDSIFPDTEVVDLSQRIPAVNYLILYDLAIRAYSQADPFEGLEETYNSAEVSWVQGEFRPHFNS